MMLPLPIFWALFDQQGSRWTLQAARMDGNFFGVFTFEPDNIQVSVVHSYWSRLIEARLSLVESFRVLLRQCLL